MSAKTIVIWSTAILLLVVAASAWVGYVGNGIAYGDAFGAPGMESELAHTGIRATRFLTMALISESVGVGMIVWLVLSEKTVALRLFAAVGIAVIASACTLALVRPT